MVFRGTPSKACQRCRERKLRCDLKQVSCSSCLRAGVQCSGYRDTSILRIADQTETVRKKARNKRQTRSEELSKSMVVPKAQPMSLESQARTVFFNTYVSDFSRTWDFLRPFWDSVAVPDYISLSIDAASLAFLAHQTYSPSALALGVKKYVSALRKTCSALQSSSACKSDALLDASLLFSLYEDITTPVSLHDHAASGAHVNGALALVKLRGVDAFNDQASLKALMRLTLNATIASLSKVEPIPDIVYDIRRQAANFSYTEDPKWRLTGLMLEATNLSATVSKDELNDNDVVSRCLELDENFAELDADMPEHWQYQRVVVNEKTQRMLENYFDVYPDRTLTQTRNVLRVSRILLLGQVFERTGQAASAIEELIRQICASAPQMTDCNLAASHKIIRSGTSHTHTLSHYLDVYILIFALYVSAWSLVCPAFTRSWIVGELSYMADHFGIREAGMVAAVLKSGSRIDPWKVYRSLGSSAFAA